MTPRNVASQLQDGTHDLRHACWEPTLDEMLSDPVVQLMMTVDGVRPDQVVTLLREARERLD